MLKTFGFVLLTTALASSVIQGSHGLSLLTGSNVTQNAFPDFEMGKDPPLGQIDSKSREEIASSGTASKMTPVPVPIREDDPFVTLLCEANNDGNYQYPFNCNQFIMCASGRAFLWECPASGAYNPSLDACVYPGLPAAQCPWPIMWHVSGVNCAIMGQRPWWSPLAIPRDPDTRCGSRLRYCLKYWEVGTGECPSGYGYSKSYNGCLPRAACLALDSWFQI